MYIYRHTLTHTHTHIQTYTYIYACFDIYVCILLLQQDKRILLTLIKLKKNPELKETFKIINSLQKLFAKIDTEGGEGEGMYT